MERCVWLIAGPTASGKSALALRLAEAIGGEIVNADSMQLYADLRVLTARPSEAEIARAPHHLFGVADGTDAWSVGRWLRAATGVLEEIAGRGNPAIIVGGTGLYFRALTEGLADIPVIPVEARTRVDSLWSREGEAAVRVALRVGDPASEARIAPGDRQRLVRALCVLQFTGVSLGAWQDKAMASQDHGPFRKLVIEPDRAALYARCDARLEAMTDLALSEVAALTTRRLDPALPVMKAVGVREFAQHIAGALSRQEALSQAQQATRNYAKRQLTWFRNQTPNWPRITALDPETAWEELRSSQL